MPVHRSHSGNGNIYFVQRLEDSRLTKFLGGRLYFIFALQKNSTVPNRDGFYGWPVYVNSNRRIKQQLLSYEFA